LIVRYPLLHVAAGLFIYIVIALLSAWLIRKFGSDLKGRKGLTTRVIMLIGLVGNGVILGSVLLLMRYLDERPIVRLGLALGSRDVVLILLTILLLSGSAVAYVFALRSRGRIDLTAVLPTDAGGSIAGTLVTGGVLFVVAIQEEVLFRGYLTLNLLPYGVPVVVIVTTLLFAGVHPLTNRPGVHEMVSWIVGGLMLSILYLVTGTLWVPIVVHFATDMINLLVFDIIGSSSFFRIRPRLEARQRSAYRLIYMVAVLGSLLVVYGPPIVRVG
jgi:membrane protease YdiL (CAAX protease family)